MSTGAHTTYWAECDECDWLVEDLLSLKKADAALDDHIREDH